MSRDQRRPVSLRTEADDVFYDDYLSRGNRQRGELRSRRNDRLPPLPQTADSLISLGGRNRRQQTAASIRSVRTRDSVRSVDTSASMKPSSFKRDGYEQLNSRLGDDPLTAIRLMRAQLVQMSLRDRLNDRDVKSTFAREAGKTLLKAEHEMEDLQRNRTNALINNETMDARKITRQMQDLRSKAIYDAYSDLLFSEKELLTYGVRSKYASNSNSNRRSRDNYSPDKSRRRDVDTSRSHRRSSYDNQTGSNFARYIHTPPNARRDTSRGRSRPFSEASFRSQTAPPPTSRNRRSSRKERTGIKKNKRLADMPPPPREKTPPPKAPKTPATDVPETPESGEPGVCVQCYERNPAFMSEEGLKNHWGNFCSCLTRCQYCDQVLHVSDLNNHHITGCQFVRGTLKPCPLCGLAQYQGSSNHPNCNLKPPPSGSAWCPLCSKAVKPFSSKAAWRKHLIDECYNNPRNVRRWSGRYAPSNGNSLLGSLGGQPIEIPTGLMPTNPQAPQINNGVGQAGTNNLQFNIPNQGQQAGGSNPQVVQRPGGALNPNQLRDAYNKLKEERRDDYMKQQNLDSALQAEKEEDDV